jgi:hypothetical protein
VRWSEEVLLLEEEMRRVIVFLRWRALWWEEQGLPRTDLSPADAEGMHAYALRQAALLRSLCDDFSKRWNDFARRVGSSKRHPEIADAKEAGSDISG